MENHDVINISTKYFLTHSKFIIGSLFKTQEPRAKSRKALIRVYGSNCEETRSKSIHFVSKFTKNVG
jgi:hypothetical protein